MTNWTKNDLERIGAADKLHLATFKQDGTLRKPVILWAVRVTKTDGWVELLVAGPCSTKQPSDVCALLLDARMRLYQSAHFAPTAEADFTHLLELAGITQGVHQTHLLGKSSSTARMLLARGLRHLLWNSKDLLDRYQILPGEQFGSALNLFQAEAQRAGILMPLSRCWFQPQDQPHAVGS